MRILVNALSITFDTANTFFVRGSTTVRVASYLIFWILVWLAPNQTKSCHKYHLIFSILSRNLLLGLAALDNFLKSQMAGSNKCIEFDSQVRSLR